MINKKRLINTFLDLVKIKSPSGNEEQISNFLIEKIKRMGLTVIKDNYGNLVAKLEGEGEPIAFACHMDTVDVGAEQEIIPIEKEDKITSDGKTILGADNKDSIAAVLEMLQIIKENNLRHRAIEIIFTKEEEAISKGAQNLDMNLIKAKECIISDKTAQFGQIVLSAPYCFNYEIKIKGKRTHVADSEKNSHFVSIVSKILTKMPLGKLNELTTNNIGSQFVSLSGILENPDYCIVNINKENRNTTPDSAHIYGQLRGADTKYLTKIVNKVKKIVQKVCAYNELRSDVSFNKLADGYLFEKNDSLIKQITSVFEKQGIVTQYINARQGSDANILNSKGLHVVVISSAHRNAHQYSEYLIKEELYQMAEFFLGFVMR